VPTTGFGSIWQLDGTTLNSREFVSDISFDRFGDTVIIGDFAGSLDIQPGTPEVLLTGSGDSSDGFITRYDPAGNLKWKQAVGTNGPSEFGISVVAADDGGAYGLFGENLFNANLFDDTIMVIRFSSTGAILWNSRLTGNFVRAAELAVSASGSVYVAGQFTLTVDFDPSSQFADRTAASERDAFLWKLSATNGSLQDVLIVDRGTGNNETGTSVDADDVRGVIWTVQCTSSAGISTEVRRVDSALGEVWTGEIVDQLGRGRARWSGECGVIVCGDYYTTTDFNPGTGVFPLTPIDSTDVYLAKLDSAGTFDFATSLGSTLGDSLNDFQTDGQTVWIAWRQSLGGQRTNVNRYDFLNRTFLLQETTSAGNASRVEALAVDPNGGVRLAANLSGSEAFDNDSSAGNVSTNDSSDVIVWRIHERPDIVGRTNAGEWYVARNERTQFTSAFNGSWNEAAGWRDVMMGDFTGDGQQDIVGRTSTGQWYVAKGGGVPLTNLFFGAWNEGAGWIDVRAADFNGDGYTDVAGRTASGQWWIGISTGGFFVTSLAGAWNPAAGWRDVVVGDFQRDGFLDIAGRTSSGQWWVLRNQGGGFPWTGSIQWAAWNEAATWRDVKAGDFNNDGRTDILGRTAAGQWWLAVSNGSAFTTVTFGGWNEAANWRDVILGDFDGNGFLDVAGRTASGQWWIGKNNGNILTFSFFGAWNEAADWRNVRAGDFNGDGTTDIAGRTSNGQWWVATSNGSALSTSFWLGWNEAAQWRSVLAADFVV
jgi:hypothetical protein